MRRCFIAFCLLIAASFGYTPALACCPLAQASAAQTMSVAPCPMHAAMAAADENTKNTGESGAAGDHSKSIAKVGCGCVAHSVSAESVDLAYGRDAAPAAQPRALADLFASHSPEQTTPPPKYA